LLRFNYGQCQEAFTWEKEFQTEEKSGTRRKINPDGGKIRNERI